MVGVLIVGFIANLLVRPVDKRFHLSRRRDTTPARGGRLGVAKEA